MALVCDIKSDASREEASPENDEDLEDGEIEDDDETVTEDQTPQVEENPTLPAVPPTKPQIEQGKPIIEKVDRDKPKDKVKEKRERRHKDKESRHMTEAEKSILHLRRQERKERDKWIKFRKEHQNVETQDDFAINLEKTLASILKKERVTSDEDKEDERRSTKRKKRNKDNEHKVKQRRTDSPKSEDMEEKEVLGVRNLERLDKDERLRSPRSEQSYDSEHSSDQSKNEEKTSKRRENKKDNKKINKNKNKNRDRNFKRDRSRERKPEPLTDSKGICIFYLNGKCNKNDCIYSHEAVPPMKLELCKFYLMDCCAKGENCSYMHSEFPCKFYHLGLPCTMGDNCKFAHGKFLSDGLKQILFKHIETAPRDILGGFPRLSRDEILNMMDLTQQKLMGMYQESKTDDRSEKRDDHSGVGDGSIPSLFDIDVPMPVELRDDNSDKKTKQSEKSVRNRPSRWQEPDPSDVPMNFAPFSFSKDQDMRVTSNGDIDMRTLPPHPLTSLPQPLPSSLPPDLLSREGNQVVNSNSTSDVDVRTMPPGLLNFSSDVDIRTQPVFDTPPPSLTNMSDNHQPFLGSKDVDIRQLRPPLIKKTEQIMAEQSTATLAMNIPSSLPKMQRELFMRIQAQQRENPVLEEKRESEEERDVQDTNWYSDDDDDDDENRLTIKVDLDDVGTGRDDQEDDHNEAESTFTSNFNSSSVKPSEVVEKLGDLSKINITADITKLLSTLSALPTITPLAPKKETETAKEEPRDPRQNLGRVLSPTSKPLQVVKTDPRLADPRSKPAESFRDPRRDGFRAAIKSEKMSIYEQGGLDLNDIDLRIDTTEEYKSSARSDVDLRTLGLPFKGMQNYTPATEIDASVSSHAPISWRVSIVDIPRPDYSGLKLSINDAEKTGDPRLKKIFGLNVEEKDTPTSPKSPRAVSRIDPRLRKSEDPKPSTQVSMDNPIMSYNQQLSTLQSSAFYQSLTSNQKVMLNQELASRADQTGLNDPILNGILTNLNLIPGIGGPGNAPLQNQNSNVGIAMNILQNVSKMNSMAQNGIMGPNVNPNIMNPNPSMLNPMGQNLMQPGLLGAAPGIPNMPQDFQMNFDPRNQTGLLGNGPQFPNFDPSNGPGPGGFQNYPNDDYYPPENNQGGFRGGNHGRSDRGGNFHGRERRRGGRNPFGRNQGNRNNFRRNQGGGRPNRPHTPP